MTAFLLVPGSHHGGWWYQEVVGGLEQHGHHALGLTLPGLDPNEPPPTEVIALDDHVNAAGRALDELRADVNDPADVVLVGHSYGGSIITALADVDPSQVRALIYLDALLPEDGDSSWSMTNDDEHQWYISGSAASGAYVDPLPFFDERARPHPLATLMQASRLTGAWHDVSIQHYVVATRWPGASPMALMAERARSDERIAVHEWDTTHNVLADGPDLLLSLLLAV